MAFTPRQIAYINSVRRRVPALRDDDLWRLVLRQTGCRRDQDGVPSLRHPANGHEAFETIMHRLSMYPDAGEDEAKWASKTRSAAVRMRRALETYAAKCVELGLCEKGALAGFVERMTARRPEYLDEPPTRNFANLDADELCHVIEGFKAWMRRQAGRLGLTAPKFGGGA